MKNKKIKVQKYVVIEDGCVTHTSNLTLEEAKETVANLSKFFDDIQFHYEPMNEYNEVEELGMMERQMNKAVFNSDL